jgi:hypothetical protein
VVWAGLEPQSSQSARITEIATGAWPLSTFLSAAHCSASTHATLKEPYDTDIFWKRQVPRAEGRAGFECWPWVALVGTEQALLWEIAVSRQEDLFEHGVTGNS